MSTTAAAASGNPRNSSNEGQLNETTTSSSTFSNLAQHGKDSFQQLGGRPTSMKCGGCASDLGIPPSVWTWKCNNGHINEYGNNICATCQDPRGPSAHWPAMLCERCGTVTQVPGSELENALKGTFASLRSELHGFIDPPTLFHCEHCNTTLVVPQGAWVCQACTESNAANIVRCVRCSQNKAAQRVLCGHCHRATAIPESGLEDVIKTSIASMSRMFHKGKLDLMGQPNVPCPSCGHAVRLPNQVHLDTVAQGAGTMPSNIAPVASSTKQPHSTEGIPASDWSIPLGCEACHHKFSMGKVGVTPNSNEVGANNATSAGNPTGASNGKGVDMQVALEAPSDVQKGTVAASK